MFPYCLKFRKNTEYKNQKVARRKKGRIMVLSRYAMCDSKISTFIQQQEPCRLLSSLGIRTPLNKMSLVDPVLFQRY